LIVPHEHVEAQRLHLVKMIGTATDGGAGGGKGRKLEKTKVAIRTVRGNLLNLDTLWREQTKVRRCGRNLGPGTNSFRKKFF